MKTLGTLTAAALAAMLVATPVMSEPGHGKGKGRGEHRARAAHHCPPGLAKKNPPCVPPGHARKAERHHHPRVGDVLRGDYVVVRDPRRLNLATRDDWRYYRDGNRAYRVDRDTRKVLAVIELINAFTN